MKYLFQLQSEVALEAAAMLENSLTLEQINALLTLTFSLNPLSFQELLTRLVASQSVPLFNVNEPMEDGKRMEK